MTIQQQHDNYTRRLALDFDTKSPAIQEDRIHRAASYLNIIGGHGDPISESDRALVIKFLEDAA